jgi:hypothetical protein
LRREYIIYKYKMIKLIFLFSLIGGQMAILINRNGILCNTTICPISHQFHYCKKMYGSDTCTPCENNTYNLDEFDTSKWNEEEFITCIEIHTCPYGSIPI